jgi:hypothetical protein
MKPFGNRKGFMQKNCGRTKNMKKLKFKERDG